MAATRNVRKNLVQAMLASRYAAKLGITEFAANGAALWWESRSKIEGDIS